MDATPSLPDPRSLHLPVTELSPIALALADLAHAPSAQAASPPLPATSPSSTAHVAARLAALIRNTQPSSPLPTRPASPAFWDDVFSKPTPPVLARELALVHALAIWADSFLPSTTRAAVHGRLAAAVRAQAMRHVLVAHLDEEVAAERDVRVWPCAMDARRGVLLAALRARYGELDKAPAAAMIAGAPFVLYAYQDLKGSERVCAPPRGLSKGEAIPDLLAGSAAYAEWCSVAQGVAVIEAVGLGAEDTVRAAVAAALKEAVKKRGLSPTLLVVDAGLDTSLCAAAGVLRAVCNTYGVHLHVEGAALALLTAGDATKKLVYDVGDFVRSAHSVVLDVASWFGKYQTAVISYCVSDMGGLGAIPQLEDGDDAADANIAPFELSRVMALWFLLERVHFPRCAAIVRSLCEQTFTLTDCLYSVPHLIECKSVGCGANVLVSYASVDANAESRTAVNRAMFWFLERKNAHMRHVLTMASHENREWLLLSPTRILNERVNSKPCSPEVIQGVCKDLIYAARRCELVVNGKAAFISQMRQCQDVEVESLPLLHPTIVYYPLFFAALRVTPFGEVSLNGHWMKDEEMTTKVEKFTYALGSLIEAQSFDSFEGLIQDSSAVNDVPFVFIGPVLPENSRIAPAPVTAIAADSNDVEDAPHLASSAVLADEWDFDESSAQDLALKAAGLVTTLVDSALHAEGDITPKEDDADAGDTENGLLSVPQGNLNGTIVADEPEQLNEETSDTNPNEESVEAIPKTSEAGIESSYANEEAGETGENGSETIVVPQGQIASDVCPVDGKRSKQRKSGFWGLIFGDDKGDDEESTGSVESSKALEDDYFRP